MKKKQQVGSYLTQHLKIMYYITHLWNVSLTNRGSVQSLKFHASTQYFSARALPSTDGLSYAEHRKCRFQPMLQLKPLTWLSSQIPANDIPTNKLCVGVSKALVNLIVGSWIASSHCQFRFAYGQNRFERDNRKIIERDPDKVNIMFDEWMNKCKFMEICRIAKRT